MHAAPAAFFVRGGSTKAPAFLTERGYALRPLRDDDLAWLRDLYASTRERELAPVPWPEATKRAFLDQQFSLQHMHYRTHFAAAEFLAIEHAAHGPVGRYYLLREPPEHRIVDICLFPAKRGQGLGAALIRHSQSEAAASGHGLRLQVERSNAAAERLYRRLGFVAGSEAGFEATNASDSHLDMRWQAPPTACLS